jgi:dehydrogenase/reductase SDR family protein 12
MTPPPNAFGRVIDGALEATVAGSFTTVGYRVRRRVLAWEDLPDRSLVGRTVLVTGATSGLGFATATAAARLGARTIVWGRDPVRTQRAAQQIRQRTGSDQVSTVVADLADLSAVREGAAEVMAQCETLDALVNNAGALTHEHTITDDGLELTYQTHVVAPFLLTHLLQPLLGPEGRVITVSSGGMYTQGLRLSVLRTGADPYDGVVAYAQAKRAQVLLNEEWALRAPTRFHAMHPGWADTPGVADSLPTFQRVVGKFLRSPEEGADTIVWLAAAEEPAQSSGRFWLDRRPRGTVRLPGTSSGPDTVARLWQQVSLDAGVAAADPVSAPEQ